MRYKPLSIREQGLEQYLNATKDKHKGLDWHDFDERMRLQVPKARIARDFGMSRSRIIEWVTIYQEQHA